MKEATSELNSTVIVVIIVGAVIAFFFSVVWPMFNSDVSNTADCSKAVCDTDVGEDGKVSCNNGKLRCPYKGYVIVFERINRRYYFNSNSNGVFVCIYSYYMCIFKLFECI